ncbi:CopY/TcrY family copper transport repressor [Hutsoniella sourekii]|uniref:CopY/TcrY family copper transport repressor n=1 Tax=Hutsoniella sourekii TaxID=87650 RepID=UPI000484B134|nr:CopY/TcrY family copper transport repressor [Hutsoniella sourekii]
MTTGITDAEWEVMRIVWAQEGLTSREIIDRAQSVTNWKEGTLKSLINRLVSKNILVNKGQKRPAEYFPSLSQSKATQEELADIFGRICNKKAGMAIQDLIQQASLSRADCQALIDTLETKKQTAPEEVPCQCPTGQCQCHLCQH